MAKTNKPLGDPKVKLTALLLTTLFSITAFAEVKPISAKEAAQLTHYRENPKLVGCMAVYQFDFFSKQLGFTVEGEEASEEDQLNQLRAFLRTGHLTVKNPKMKFPRYLVQHCQSVAETAVEMLALNLAAQPTDDAEPKVQSFEN